MTREYQNIDKLGYVDLIDTVVFVGDKDGETVTSTYRSFLDALLQTGIKTNKFNGVIVNKLVYNTNYYGLFFCDGSVIPNLPEYASIKEIYGNNIPNMKHLCVKYMSTSGQDFIITPYNVGRHAHIYNHHYHDIDNHTHNYNHKHGYIWAKGISDHYYSNNDFPTINTHITGKRNGDPTGYTLPMKWDTEYTGAILSTFSARTFGIYYKERTLNSYTPTGGDFIDYLIEIEGRIITRIPPELDLDETRPQVWFIFPYVRNITSL